MASTSSTARSNGLGQGRAAPRISGAASARCRLPPNTISASSIRPRATGVKPSTPSSPMPTMDSQRRGAAVLARKRSQPTTCDASSFSAARRRRGSWRERLADAPDLAVTVSLAGRTRRRRRSRAGADRRLRRRRGPRRYLAAERIDVLIDATHPLRRHISANAARAARVAACRCSRSAGRRGRRAAGDRWTEVADPARGGARARRHRRAACSSRSAGRRSAAFAQRAAAPLSGPQRRAGRSAAGGAARDPTSSARGPFTRSRRSRAAAAHAHRHRRRQEQRRRRDLRQDRGGARARPRGDHAAPAAPAGGADRRRRSRTRWPGSIMRARSRPSAACRPAARGPAARSTRVAAEPTMTSVAMSAHARIGRGERRRPRCSRPARPTARPKITGVVARQVPPQELERLAELPWPRLRDRIVERDDEAGAAPPRRAAARSAPRA